MRFQRRFLSQDSLARRLLIIGLCIAALVLFLRLGSDRLFSSSDRDRVQSLKPLGDIPAKAQQVQTGFYATKVYELNTTSNTFYADFYIWFRWEGEIDPLANLEFINAVEEWGMSNVPAYEEPRELPDGSSYQMLRVEGRFVHPFELTRYPLDRQLLGIQIENTVETFDRLVYVADTKGSGIEENIVAPGWKFGGYQLQNLRHDYPTQFGDPTAQYSYSALRYEMPIFRPISFFIWKLLLPLIVVLVATWGGLLLKPSYPDSRIIIPVTALLTIVFLQQSYSANLPEVGYLVLLDKIYVLAYLLVIAALMEAIVTADWVQTGKPEDYARVIKLDRILLIGQLIFLIVGVAILVLT
jgi:hypothetical protein